MDESGMPSPKDLANVAEGASKFTDALSKAFPGHAIASAARGESKATKRAMKDIAAARKWGKDANLSDEAVELICNDIYRRATRQERFESVVSFARESVPDDFDPKPIDQTWAEQFRKHAEGICDEDMQQTWGKILAGEMDEPGTFTKRAMNIMSELSRDEARLFERFCSRCLGGRIGNGTFVSPLAFSLEAAEPAFAMTRSEKDALENARLVIFGSDFITHTTAINFAGGQPIAINSHDYYMRPGARSEIHLELFTLTPEGAALSRLCSLGNAPGFENAAIGFLESKGAQIAPITRWESDSEFIYLTPQSISIS